MLVILVLVIFVIQPVLNLPQKRSADPSIISTSSATDQHIIPNAVKDHQDIVPIAIKRDLRKKKGINIAYQLPGTHHLLLPSQLHVLPATSNVRHSSVHTGVQHILTSSGQIPVYSQTVSHSSTNITHPTQLVPISFPNQHNIVSHNHLSHQNHLQQLHQNHLHNQQNIVQHNLVAQHLLPQHLYHDVSVIPLHRAQKYTQLRSMENSAEDRDDTSINRFRMFYGGYGTGLYFGGHGAGHGFYAYGK